MNKKVSLYLMVALILGTIVWTFQTVRPRTHSGARIGFKVGSGELAVTNPGSRGRFVCA